MSDTIIMITPENDLSSRIIDRWAGMKRAFEKAGAIVDPVPYADYGYPRDPFVLIDKRAHYPLPPGEERMSNRLQALWPHIQKHGYEACPVSAYGGYEYNGGNFIHDTKRRTLLAGLNVNLTDSIEDTFRRSAILMSMSRPRDLTLSSMNDVAFIDTTDIHIDCFVGLLPNGQLLVKLDELGCQDIRDPSQYIDRLTGVTPYGLKKLERIYGRENLITFAFSEHMGADICLGINTLEDDRKSTWLAMLANFEFVGDTIIGETFPTALEKIITERGMKTISAQDMGLETFLLGEPGGGFTGGVHCSSLKIS